MKATFKSVAFFIVILFNSNARAGEPTGGVIKDLVFFNDTINDSLRFHRYGCTGPTLSTLAHTGRRSMRFSPVAMWGGFQVWWGGDTDQNNWWGPDTAVFWAHSNSVFTLWFRSNTVGDDIHIAAYGFNTFYGFVGTGKTIIANAWQKIEFEMPPTLLNLPLKGFEIGLGSTLQPVYIDDFVVTNVRMYAGIGPLPQLTLDNIASSQIGYAPNMKKQFTSPVDFDSFRVARVSDSVVVYQGGTSIKSVSSYATSGAVAYIGDFSAFTTPGRYRILAGGRESLPFNVGVNVFDAPLRAAQRFFYYQRAFTAVQMPYAEGPWVHPSDSAKAPPGTKKGWHDAGDLTVYMPTMTQSVFWLLETWMDFRPMSDTMNIPESGNGVPDILDETRWGVEWVKSQQDSTGGFWGNTCANEGNHYQYGLTTPNNISGYAKTVAPNVQNTAKAVAVLAYASKVYRLYDSVFAAQCLNAAQAGWVWLQVYPNQSYDLDMGNCNAYAQGTDTILIRSHKMWAAASLLYATGDSTYEAAYQALYLQTFWISSFSRSEAFAAKMYLRCTTNASPAKQNELRQIILQAADGVRHDGDAHPFQWATHYYWGALSNAAHRAGQFSWMAYLLDSSRAADRDQLLHNVHYMFGRNYLNLCYMSGADSWGATNWRKEGFHHWMKALNASPWHFPGAVAGGPNDGPSWSDVSYPDNLPQPIYGYYGDPRYPRNGATPADGRFTDNDSWSTNEIAINWQAAILYALYAAQSVAYNTSIPFPVADTTKPVISDVQASTITSSQATVTWMTNEPAGTVVEYGLTTSYTKSKTVMGKVLNHSVTLDSLLANITYHYRVKSVDTAGNASFSGDHSFMTGTATSYAPSGTTIMQGSLSSGSYVNLAANDQNYYVIKSTSGATNVADWYGSVTIAESLTTNMRLIVTYDGKYSKNGTAQILYLYNWTSSAWAQIDSQTVGTNDVSIAKILSSPADFVSATKQVRMRVNGTGAGSRSCSADFMRFVVETLGSEFFVRSDAVIARRNTGLPVEYKLHQNYPNPFNPTTTIRYDLPNDQRVTLKIYDILGREVKTLVDDIVPAGYHQIVYDASSLASGAYFYRIQTEGFTSLKKMMVLK